MKNREKQIPVNQTDETVTGFGEVADDEAVDMLVQDDVEIIEPTDPDALEAFETIQAAEAADDPDEWNKVAALLYRLERNKAKLPGLHQSTLGRLLERLP